MASKCAYKWEETLTVRTRKPFVYFAARLIYKLGLDERWGNRWPMPKGDGKRDCAPAFQAAIDERGGIYLSSLGGDYRFSGSVFAPGEDPPQHSHVPR
jgi:hypothetical protein